MSAPTPIWKGTTALVETVRSGVTKYAERVTYIQEFEGQIATARTFADLHYRGSIWTISGFTGTFYVDDTTVSNDRGGKGTVTVNYTWLGSLPPDEWCVTPIEINPAIERHTFFSSLSDAELVQARAAFNSFSVTAQDSMASAITAATHAALIANLLAKWRKGAETFYMAGSKYQWTVFLNSLSGVTMRMGGYRETPGGPGTLPPSFTWLRMADDLSWNNGMYKLTRSWVGSASYISYWDTDLYGTTPQ